uniref:Uncharacterized protein n=1 Tax=Anguilla anguilla TaxID=7936 RepID=A0A0E9UAW5_ANGAN
MLCLQERPVGSHGVQGDTAPNSSPFPLLSNRV